MPRLPLKSPPREGCGQRRARSFHDYLRFLRSRQRYVPENRAEFRGLLGRIALNLVRDAYAAGGRQPLSEDEITRSLGALGPRAVTPPEEAAARDEWRDWVQLGLELVAPDDRRVIEARLWRGLPFADVAGELDLPSGNAARMRFQRVDLVDQVRIRKAGVTVHEADIYLCSQFHPFDHDRR